MHVDMQGFADSNIKLDYFIEALSLDVAISGHAKSAQDAKDAQARNEDTQAKIEQMQADSALSQVELMAAVEQLRKDVKGLPGFIDARRSELEAKKKCILDYSDRSVLIALNKISLSEVQFDPEGLPIGEGTFGKVFKATYKRNAVAIKVLKSSTEADLKELAREARIMQAVDHPCIVTMFGIVHSEGRPGSASNVLCVVMALSRCSLDDLLYKTRAELESVGVRPPNCYLLDVKSDTLVFASPLLLALLEDASSAIEYLHSLGVIHM